jgi:DNA-binding response OmpR family regulator
MTSRDLQTGSVLIVDDDAEVRHFIATVLSFSGYRTLTAASAHEALKTLLDPAESIVLLITDIRMPGGSGLDLAGDLAVANLHIPILYISGLTESIVVQGIATSNPQAILTKPFSPSELVSRVRDLWPPSPRPTPSVRDAMPLLRKPSAA